MSDDRRYPYVLTVTQEGKTFVHRFRERWQRANFLGGSKRLGFKPKAIDYDEYREVVKDGFENGMLTWKTDFKQAKTLGIVDYVII
jgi:hypothetical protein